MLLLSNKKLEPYLLTIVNVLARGSHLLFYLVVGNRFGVSNITDEVVFLQTPLFVLMAIIVGAVEAVVMPAFHRVGNPNNAKFLYIYAVRRIVYIVLPFSGMLLLVFSLLQSRVDWVLLCILLPLPLFGSLAALKTGLLNASNRFRVALIGPLSGGLFAVPLILAVEPGVYSLALSFLLFELGKFFGLQFFSDIATGGCSIKSSSVEKVVKWATGNAVWQIFGSMVLAMVIVVDMLFANSLSNGSVTLVEYANKLWNIVPLLFVGHITLTYTALSKSASKGSIGAPQLVNILALRYGVVAFLLSTVIIYFSRDLIVILYGVGAFSLKDQARLTGLLQYYLIGAGPFVAGLVYVRAFSAVGRTQVLTVVACAGLFVNIVCDFLLIKRLGLDGIGLATSLVCVANTLLLAVFYKYSFKQESYVARRS